MKIDSFRAVIRLWTTPDAMAVDIGAGVSATRKWLHRDRIPDEWWQAVLKSPPAVKAGLTAETFVELAARNVPANEAAS